MKKALNCSALIGDSLYLLKPIDLYLQKFRDECEGLIVLPNLGGDIVRAHFKDTIPIFNSEDEVKQINPDVEILRLEAGRALQIALDHYGKYKEQVHISQAFGFMLGVNCDGDVTPPLEWIPENTQEKKERIAVIGPFSNSCTRHSGKEPNKTIDDWKWEYIIRYLRKHNYKVLCGGAPKDYLTLVSLPISSYRSGSLQDMIELFQSASLLITLDNGQLHIASACGTPTLALFASEGYIIPPQFILPLWAKKTSYVMMGKASTAKPAELLYGIKEMLRKMESENILT